MIIEWNADIVKNLLLPNIISTVIENVLVNLK